MEIKRNYKVSLLICLMGVLGFIGCAEMDSNTRPEQNGIKEGGGSYSKFGRYGISFTYPSEYDIKTEKKETHVNIFMKGENSRISVQIVNGVMGRDLRLDYMEVIKNQMEEFKLVLDKSENNIKEIEIREGGEKVKVRANYNKLIFKEEVEDYKIVMLVYFFAHKDTGYIINFAYNPKMVPMNDFEIVSKSFTIRGEVERG